LRSEIVLKKLINNSQCSDVELILEDGTIPAHKAILASRSEFFNKMLSTASDNSKISLSNKKKNVILPILEYLYCFDSESKVDSEDFEHSMCAAHEFNLEHLVTLYKVFMVQEISFECSLSFLMMANLLDLNDIKEFTIMWIVTRWQEWQKCSAYKTAVKNAAHLSNISTVLSLLEEHHSAAAENLEKYRVYERDLSAWQAIYDKYFPQDTSCIMQ